MKPECSVCEYKQYFEQIKNKEYKKLFPDKVFESDNDKKEAQDERST